VARRQADNSETRADHRLVYQWAVAGSKPKPRIDPQDQVAESLHLAPVLIREISEGMKFVDGGP